MSSSRRFLAAALLVFAAACSEPLPVEKRDYVGEWHGKDMLLVIGADGTVAYKRVKGRETTTVNAPIQRFDGASFIVGIGPMNTRFEVSSPPHKDGNAWKMTVDGVELTRGPGGAGDERSA